MERPGGQSCGSPAGTPDPEAWVAAARGGDSEAFSRLAELHEVRLFRQAVSLCGDRYTAEDLCAETLIEAWKSIARFRGRCRFSTWLYGILFHRYQKWIRRAQSRPPTAASLPTATAEAAEAGVMGAAAEGAGVVEEVADRELARDLRRVISRLRAPQQAVILMRFYEDASLAEMAAALGVPVGTVKSRLHHGLVALRRRMEGMNLESSAGDQGV